MKRVALNAKIVLGGVDISNHVTRWSVGAGVNELYVAQIDVVDNPSVIEIVQGVRHRSGNRVAIKDKIVIKGGAHHVDISRWISGYDKRSRVGEFDTIRLYVQCDSESLRINDATPWEETTG